jgi:hypothetical protein
MSDIDDKEDKEKENTTETRSFHTLIFLYIPISHLIQFHSRLHNHTPITSCWWLVDGCPHMDVSSQGEVVIIWYCT